MRYRKLTATGDYTFGHGGVADFYANSPVTVAQAVSTALKLIQGEWFLDITAGMPWNTQVLGYGTKALYDTAIKTKILSVQGVNSIKQYNSTFDGKKRALSVSVTIDTIFGAAFITSNVGITGGYGGQGYGSEGYGE